MVSKVYETSKYKNSIQIASEYQTISSSFQIMNQKMDFSKPETQ